MDSYSEPNIDRIDLAHVPAFRLGRLSVSPATRQLVHRDGRSEILQPRVMQVLVALAQADGAILTRDELTARCWEGRVVGEDAINRILSRLRALANGIGAGSFRIETVTRVGYRLLVRGRHEAEPADAAGSARAAGWTDAAPSRRALLASGCAAALGAIGALGWNGWGRGAAGEAERARVEPLMEQAQIALSQQSPWHQNQAITLYQRVVAEAPGYADGWAALGNAYALAARHRSIADAGMYRALARSAARRALELDPQNSFGRLALVMARPAIGNWFAAETMLRGVLAGHDRNVPLLFALAGILASVGRNFEALPLLERMETLVPGLPPLLAFHIRALWSVDRLAETERLMGETAAHFPTFLEGWFTRFYVLLYSGRPDAAIHLAENRAWRPAGVPEREFESIMRVARAAADRNPARIDAIIAEQAGRARQGAGYAENAIQFACALGRVDEAFRLAEAYYFGRGFVVPDLRFTPDQPAFSPSRDRQTSFLFRPVTQPMRADPRFDALASELGLKAYWARVNGAPDRLASIRMTTI
jgi:DNA-binding winged helix-turn-helix (wHTH) protein/tetratricopeptide (TPR) repeat protein